MEELLKNIKEELENLNIDSSNLISAIGKLVGILHAHNLDEEAIKAFAECGIKLEIEVK